jgi:hypothetical protein
MKGEGERVAGCALVVGGRDVVLVGTVVLQRTVALHICLAVWPVRVEAEAVFAPEEVREAEVVGGLRRGLGDVPGRLLHLGGHVKVLQLLQVMS